MSAWLLIEVAGPWGRDAVVQSALGPFAPAVWREAMRRRGIRLVAIRRDLAHPDHGVLLVHVAAARPGGRPVAHRRVIAELHDVVRVTESLASGGSIGAGWEPDDERYVLVCTNGRHDGCCATFGRPVVRVLRQSAWRQQVWECSHIGGDRFAANVVVLPDSIYFGQVGADEAVGLVDAHAAGRLDLTRYRGRSTLRQHEQAAEHAVRRSHELDTVDAVQRVVTGEDGSVVLDLADGRRVRVRLRRTEVASATPLTCRGRTGATIPAFRIVSIEDSA